MSRPDRVIPKSWLSDNARIFRVIIHWTAGSYKPTGLDRRHYHCILQDQQVLNQGTDVIPIRGIYGPETNNNTADKVYAAHTKGLNSNSYGLSAACMLGAKEGGPYGKYPLTLLLWERLAQAAAEIVIKYDLAITPRTVLQHGEVEEIYGIQQRGKWDINVKPWEPGDTKEEVWAEFRRKIVWYRERVA